jgi:phosphomannomutase
MNYVFDVDGTITPSRGLIDLEFQKYFYNFCLNNPVYLCSGSDYTKTLEQVGSDICNAVQAVYSCAGNAKYVKGEEVYTKEFSLDDSQYKFLMELLSQSTFRIRTGNHLESRTGLYNFSIVGRNADRNQRKQYYEFDKSQKERIQIANKINEKFLALEATVAGETGIDIYLRGCDKSQIAKDISPFIFFGDSIYPDGNDWSVAQKAIKFYHVYDWNDTWDYLINGAAGHK